jgi:hypothetical protein
LSKNIGQSTGFGDAGGGTLAGFALAIANPMDGPFAVR